MNYNTPPNDEIPDYSDSLERAQNISRQAAAGVLLRRLVERVDADGTPYDAFEEYYAPAYA